MWPDDLSLGWHCGIAHVLMSAGTSYLQIEPLRKALQKCKEDNCKMAVSMETLLKSSQQMEGSVQCLQDELEKKTYLMEQLQTAR